MSQSIAIPCQQLDNSLSLIVYFHLYLSKTSPSASGMSNSIMDTSFIASQDFRVN